MIVKVVGGRYVCQSRMSYFWYVAEDRTKWDKGRRVSQKMTKKWDILYERSLRGLLKISQILAVAADIGPKHLGIFGWSHAQYVVHSWRQRLKEVCETRDIFWKKKLSCFSRSALQLPGKIKYLVTVTFIISNLLHILTLYTVLSLRRV